MLVRTREAKIYNAIKIFILKEKKKCQKLRKFFEEVVLFHFLLFKLWK